MLSIVICVGSSCHVRGSDDLAENLEQLIADHGLQERVELVGAFCMERCSMGVSVRIEENEFSGLRPDEAEAFFMNEVLPRIGV
jgi:NADH:ubiquinone oxidoreductase subunit E